MAVTIGGVSIQIGANPAELYKGLAKAERALKKSGENFKAIGSQLSIGLSAPLAVLSGAAFKMASDFDESLNKVRVAFGSSSADVEAFGETTLRTIGLAKGSALEMAALFGDMATSLGLPQGEAAKLSTSMVTLAGDLASFKNISVAEAQTALSGIFTGETESLKRLGVVMLDSTLQAFALTQGITKQYKEFTQAEKVQLRYAYVMESTKNAQGDFQRTAGGAANQMRTFQESVKELSTSFGQILLPVFTPIITKVNELLQAFNGLTTGQKQTIVIFAGIAAAIGPVLVVVGQLITSYGAVAGAIKGLIAVSPALSAALTTSLGPISVAVAAIAAGVYLIVDNWDLVSTKLKDIYKEFITVRVAVNAVVFAVKSVYDVFVAIFDTVVNLGSTIKTAFRAALSGENIFDALKPNISEFNRIGYALGQSLGKNTEEGFRNIVTGEFGKKDTLGALQKSVGKLNKAFPTSTASTGAVSPLSIGGGSTGTAGKPEARPLISAAKLFSAAEFSKEFNTIGQAFEDSNIFQSLKSKVETARETIKTELADKLPKVQIVPLINNENIAIGLQETIDLTKEFSAAITATMGATFELIGDSLANALTGDAGFSNFFNGLIGIVADFMSTFGKQVLAIGVAKLGIEKLFQTGGAAGAIAAGVGLIVLGKVVKKLFSKPPSLDIGTDLVKKDGLAKIHRGEAIIPAAVVKSGGFTGGKGVSNVVVTGIIKGQDILLSNRYGQDTASRYR
jgi:hypothetical protein